MAVGDALPTTTLRLDRAALVAYTAASRDFNAIHWSDRVATEVGLPGVIAHGMLTMGAASRLLTEWAGDPTAVVGYSTRFTRPVVVPDPGEAVVEVERRRPLGRRGRPGGSSSTSSSPATARRSSPRPAPPSPWPEHRARGRLPAPAAALRRGGPGRRARPQPDAAACAPRARRPPAGPAPAPPRSRGLLLDRLHDAW